MNILERNEYMGQRADGPGVVLLVGEIPASVQDRLLHQAATLGGTIIAEGQLQAALRNGERMNTVLFVGPIFHAKS